MHSVTTPFTVVQLLSSHWAVNRALPDFVSLRLATRAFRQSVLSALVLIATVLGGSNFASSQDSSDEKASEQAEVSEEPDAPILEAPDKVEVNPEADDEDIATRLREILQSTEWYRSPEVRVDNGVVFLSGSTKSEEHKQWATDLAGNTQDVAAVVNRMTVHQKSIWDFTPAYKELRSFQASAVQAIPFVLFGITVLAATWLIARIVRFIANRILEGRIPNSLLRWVTTRAITLPILIFGIYLVLRVSGLTQLALTVLGGTGLIGLIIGIAFQDIAENFLASILISVQQPFRIGDVIQVGDHEGIVQRVTTRGTSLLTVDGNHVQIPNAQVYKDTIVNFTANPLRRISFDIGIGYDDSATEAQKILLKKLKEHDAALSDPAPKVLIDVLGSATVVLRVLFWIDGAKHDWPSVRSSVMRIAKQSLQVKGISLPDEAREVIFPNGVPVVMENNANRNTDSDNGSSKGETDPVSVTVDSAAPKSALVQPNEEAVSEAEGGMASESEDLQKQAKGSWLPGEGDDILVGEK